MPHDTLTEQALAWRRWATGEDKDPPHNLLAFTTAVIAAAAELARVSRANDELRSELSESQELRQELARERETMRNALQEIAQHRGGAGFLAQQALDALVAGSQVEEDV